MADATRLTAVGAAATATLGASLMVLSPMVYHAPFVARMPLTGALVIGVAAAGAALTTGACGVLLVARADRPAGGAAASAAVAGGTVAALYALERAVMRLPPRTAPLGALAYGAAAGGLGFVSITHALRNLLSY